VSWWGRCPLPVIPTSGSGARTGHGRRCLASGPPRCTPPSAPTTSAPCGFRCCAAWVYTAGRCASPAGRHRGPRPGNDGALFRSRRGTWREDDQINFLVGTEIEPAACRRSTTSAVSMRDPVRVFRDRINRPGRPIALWTSADTPVLRVPSSRECSHLTGPGETVACGCVFLQPLNQGCGRYRATRSRANVARRGHGNCKMPESVASVSGCFVRRM
jgi:hypothetical protein